MNIADVKQAEEFLIEVTRNKNIGECIEEAIDEWDLGFEDFGPKLQKSLCQLKSQIFLEEQDNLSTEALEMVVFDKIHDFCWACINPTFQQQDSLFLEKCKVFLANNISAEQFGANENYSIPLCAAIVELSVLDKYKTPSEKMNCLCTTYDLVFAELKTAIVSMISENIERQDEIPVIDNRDVLPVLMVVLIKSKLLYMCSNLYYIKSFCHLDSYRIRLGIFTSFELAVNALMELEITDLRPIDNKMIQSIDLQEYMKITTSSDEKVVNKTLVDEANQRVVKLITQATNEQQ